MPAPLTCPFSPRLLAVAALLGALVWPSVASAKKQYIMLDGHRTTVNWSDGDSFRVVGGPHKGLKTRITLYNSLESYGPVHSWGGFGAWELSGIAKAATKFVKDGVWSCKRSGNVDGYGRHLVECEDLAVAILEAGLAHVFHVGDGEPKASLVVAQHLAQKKRRGMWAKGVPRYIVTSMHSMSEDRSRESGRSYNRICDTRSGKSEKVDHKRSFEVCDAWCHGGSCMTYVPFDVRYDYKGGRPSCLRTGNPKRFLGLEDIEQAEQYIMLDGRRTRVDWDDGDTFEILEGPSKGTKTRLHGFNTLEGYGPVHFWGDASADDLYTFAKAGTRMARSREWVCFLSDKEGGYGRKEVDCPELAKAQVREGFAHVFAIREDAPADLLRVQVEAQEARSGMWSAGIPRTIVTSVHAHGENPKYDTAYNRVVHTRTGQSWGVEHKTRYRTCEAFCHGGSCMLYIPHGDRYSDKPIQCLLQGDKSRLSAGPDVRVPALVEP